MVGLVPRISPTAPILPGYSPLALLTRYLLHVWSGKRKGKSYWWPSSQSTSSTLLPDGAILTAFGTGYRIKAGNDSPQAPRDVGLIEWQLNSQPVNAERAIRDAAFDSDLRNVFDPKE